MNEYLSQLQFFELVSHSGLRPRLLLWSLVESDWPLTDPCIDFDRR